MSVLIKLFAHLFGLLSECELNFNERLFSKDVMSKNLLVCRISKSGDGAGTGVRADVADSNLQEGTVVVGGT